MRLMLRLNRLRRLVRRTEPQLSNRQSHRIELQLNRLVHRLRLVQPLPTNRNKLVHREPREPLRQPHRHVVLLSSMPRRKESDRAPSNRPDQQTPPGPRWLVSWPRLPEDMNHHRFQEPFLRVNLM